MSNGHSAQTTLTLCNINIERSRHLARVTALLSRTAPDVVCLQELIEDDISGLCSVLGYPHHLYVPMMQHPGEGQVRFCGVAILSRFPLLAPEIVRYAGGGSGSDRYDLSTADGKVRTSRYAVAIAAVAMGDSRFTVGCTHFPWTPDGSPSDHQRRACDQLLAVLGQRELVLCGDFNAPRGGEIFTRLAARWHDNIPASYVTSIDPELHKAGPLQLMVDGVFSTPEYRIRNVVLHQGVSDHCAITGEVARGCGGQRIPD